VFAVYSRILIPANNDIAKRSYLWYPSKEYDLKAESLEDLASGLKRLVFEVSVGFKQLVSWRLADGQSRTPLSGNSESRAKGMRV
jgi:hypothetical protein